jgi:hypothetical protein
LQQLQVEHPLAAAAAAKLQTSCHLAESHTQAGVLES